MALVLLYGFVDGWVFWGEVAFATCWTLLIGNLAFTSYVFLQLGIVWLVVYNLLFTTVMSFAFRHEVIAAIALIPFLIICPVIAVKLQAKSRSKPAEQEAFH